jgi:DnaD/phage-associated family protein
MTDTTFTGFANSAAGTVIPNAFFARVLPEITDPAELVVSAYVFFALGLRQRQPRFLTLRELEADAGLALALANLCGEGALQRGLELGVARGTLVRATLPHPTPHPQDEPEGMSLRVRATLPHPTPRPLGKPEGMSRRERTSGETLYTTNMPANVRGLERLAAEGVSIEEPRPAAEREAAPNIFALYEANIGSITPLLVDELREAEERYPAEWIEDAFREAAELNKRSWRYVRAILQRWETEGRGHEEHRRNPEADWLARRYREGKRPPSRAAP